MPPPATTAVAERLPGFRGVLLGRRPSRPRQRRHPGFPEGRFTRLGAQVGHGYSFAIRKLDTVHQQVQEAIRPQAVALAVLGALAALALLVLVGQALAELVERAAGQAGALRAMGLTRSQNAMASGLGGALAVGRRDRRLPSQAPWPCRRWPRSDRCARSTRRAASSSTRRCCWAAAQCSRCSSSPC